MRKRPHNNSSAAASSKSILKLLICAVPVLLVTISLASVGFGGGGLNTIRATQKKKQPTQHKQNEFVNLCAQDTDWNKKDIAKNVG